MKRIAVVILLLFTATAAVAAPYWTVMLDNEPMAAEMPPLVVGNGVLLVSARSLFNAMHVHYEFDPATSRLQVTSTATTMEMTENVPQASINGRAVRMPVAPRRESGVMLVPLPFAAEPFGYSSQVDAGTKTFTLTSGMAPAPATQPAVAVNPTLGNPPTNVHTRPGRLVPSAIPYLMTGNIPPGQEYGSVQQLPPMGPTAVIPNSGGTQIPTQSYGAPQIPQMENPLQIPAVDTRMPGANSWPSVDNGAPPSYQLPAASGGSASSPVFYDSSKNNAPPVGSAPAILYSPPPTSMPGSDSRNPYSSSVGKMDSVDPLDNFYDANSKPDPAVTGLTIERRYDSFVDTYVVHYRITNLGGVAADKPMLVRLKVGGKGGLQTVQEVVIDRLDSQQSLSYNWSGDAHAYPFLYDVTIKAEASIVLDDQAPDANKRNNTRSVRISY